MIESPFMSSISFCRSRERLLIRLRETVEFLRLAPCRSYNSFRVHLGRSPCETRMTWIELLSPEFVLCPFVVEVAGNSDPVVIVVVGLVVERDGDAA